MIREQETIAHESEAESDSPSEEAESSDLIGDPVRMYLREIASVSLLKAADERRFAFELDSSKRTLNVGPVQRIPSSCFSGGSRATRGCSMPSLSTWRLMNLSL